MNNRKRLLSLLMTLVLLIGLLPGDAFAAECSHVWGAKTYDSTPHLL